MTTGTRSTMARRPVQVAAIALGAAVLVLVAVTVQALTAGPGPTTTALTGPAHASEGAPDPAPGAGSDSGVAHLPADVPADVPADLPAGADGPTPSTATAGVAEYIHPEILETAARQAPFSPNREGASARYRLPEDRVAQRPLPAPAEAPAPPQVPAFQLLGAVAGNGNDDGWVILTVVGEEPRLLAVGESMHGYRVAQVVGSSAMLTGNGGNYRVTVADPSPTGSTVAIAAEVQERGRRNPAQEAREQALQQRELQQRALEVARQLQERVGAEGGQLRFEGDRIMLTSPDGRNVRFERIVNFPPTTTPPAPTRRPPGGGNR